MRTRTLLAWPSYPTRNARDTRGPPGSYLLRALTDFKKMVETDSGTARKIVDFASHVSSVDRYVRATWQLLEIDSGAAHKTEFGDRAASHGIGRRQCHRHLFGAARGDRAPGRELEESLSIDAWAWGAGCVWKSITAWSLASRCTSRSLVDTRGSPGSYLLRALTDSKIGGVRWRGSAQDRVG